MTKRAPSITAGGCTSVTSQSGTKLLIVEPEGAMKNIQDVLREKEAEIEKLNREIKLLRVAARLLEDENTSQAGRTAEAAPHHAEPAMNLEEPVLDVLPAPGPANGDASKRWP